MKVVVLGGTGFMGYSFVRSILGVNSISPVVYSTNPKSLVNIARHDIDIRILNFNQLSETLVDSETKYILNFAHPFSIRDNLRPSEQINVLYKFLKHNLYKYSKLRVVHISSMSVYEPFDCSTPYIERNPLRRPPSIDTYATAKYTLEKNIRKLSSFTEKIMILRPTVVYGPYCRPWTDNILRAFHEDNIEYNNLDGRIQPIFADDISRFIKERLDDFRAGVFNIAGPQIIRWHEFFSFYGQIVSKGKLLKVSNSDKIIKNMRYSKLHSIKSNFRDFMKTCSKDPAFINLASPILSKIPVRMRQVYRYYFNLGQPSFLETPGLRMEKRKPMPYCDSFFSKDRVVSTEHFNKIFSNFSFTKIAETTDVLKKYYSYRFTDEIFH